MSQLKIYRETQEPMVVRPIAWMSYIHRASTAAF